MMNLVALTVSEYNTFYTYLINRSMKLTVQNLTLEESEDFASAVIEKALIKANNNEFDFKAVGAKTYLGNMLKTEIHNKYRTPSNNATDTVSKINASIGTNSDGLEYEFTDKNGTQIDFMIFAETKQKQDTTLKNTLTDRELRYIELLDLGYTESETAEILKVSEPTLRVLKTRLLAKLNLTQTYKSLNHKANKPKRVYEPTKTAIKRELELSKGIDL
jgi:RNA polymerase sigma factor (sigma-70 family)